MHLTFSVNAAIQKGKGLDLEVDPQTLLSLDTPWKKRRVMCVLCLTTV